MKKTIAALTLISTLFCLVSCLGPRKFKYMHDTTEISRVEIVEVVYDCRADDLNILSLTEIPDVDEFVARLSDVKYRAVFTDPFFFNRIAKGLAVKVSYSNGDYELFNTSSRARFYCDSGGLDLNVHADHFDEYEFKSMLQHYLQHTQAKYTRMYDSSEIEAIDYVKCNYENGKDSYEVLAAIGDVPAFIADFDKLQYLYDAPGTDGREAMITSGEEAFRITYKNGDFELFNEKGREEVCSLHSPKGAVNIGHFDSEQFSAFVKKYTTP